jgi:hypothetical protein
MVLYHANGRVVIAHEDYLENLAALHAAKKDVAYEDQTELCKAWDRYGKEEPGTMRGERPRIYIVVDKQKFHTLHATTRTKDLKGVVLPFVTKANSERLPPKGIDRNTLVKCSTLAEDFFGNFPDEKELHLPVKYPRRHMGGFRWTKFLKEYGVRPAPGANKVGPLHPRQKYVDRDDPQMAFIRPYEIEEYVTPWLLKMEPVVRNKELPDPEETTEDELPKMRIPDKLEEKIHLYNAMLQLGLPRFVQEPVIDATVLQMYQAKLNACHLETLEITVGRFYGEGVAILDPVINHLIGTYAFRNATDRENPEPKTRIPAPTEPSTPTPEPSPEPSAVEDSPVEPSPYESLQPEFLTYSSENGLRDEYPNDTFIVPPELPVLGHCIRHWSGVRSNGSTAAAYTGFPLNVGKHKRFVRRDAATQSSGNRVKDKPNHLAGQKYYLRNRPGLEDGDD